MAHVAVSSFRAELKDWLDKVRAGEEVVLTDHGRPFARVVRLDAEDVFARLEREGKITRPLAPKRKWTAADRVKASGSVSEFVARTRRR